MSGGAVEVELRLPGWARSASVRRHGLAVTAALLLLAGLTFKGWLLSRSYFAEDDIVFIGRAVAEPFGWDHLLRVHIGHLMPGSLALVRVMTAISPYGWTLVSAVILALCAAAALALYRLLRLLCGARPLILVPLAFFLFAPANFQAGTWFAAALNILPLQVAMLMAMCSQVLLIRTGGLRHALAGVAWTCAGLLFFEKALLIPPVLLFLTVLLSAREHGVIGAARRHLGLWAAHLAVGGVYLLGYVLAAGRAGGQGFALPDFYTAADYAGTFFGGTVPTLLVGGPLSWGGETTAGPLVAHRPVEVAVAWLVLAAVVAGTCRGRPAAVPAWSLAAGYLLVADGLLIMIVRTGPWSASESRYIADAMPVLAVCLALVLMPWRDLPPGTGPSPRGPSPRAGPPPGEALPGAGAPPRDPPPAGGSARAVSLSVLPAVCAYVALALVSASGFARGLPGEANRAYFAAARADLAALGPETGVYPALLPDRLMFPWQAMEDRLTSRALSPLARGALRERISRPGAAHRAVTFDDRGHLVPATVFGGYVAAPAGSCLPLRGGTAVADLPEARAGNIVRVDYRVSRDTPVTVLRDGRRSEVLLRAGRDRVYFPAEIARGPVRISVPGGSACLRAVVLGAAVPERPAGGAARAPAVPPRAAGGGPAGAVSAGAG
ncbi:MULTISPECIES: hypothetical protein [Streptosporangium]|uniref:Glycosyltransferase RgtA/B/C/D-like domain-containing protein n=1 Tax=Streptosporangium brasiliense TaxID=47480 RepID=A0ABT9R0D8_9ACTN|nr:hypothetical protein [Streptosporangium brasiliense]MDP9862679.1 hypothetical protein [Streptosporangium brasiliense]